MNALAGLALLFVAAPAVAQAPPPNGESWELFQGWKAARRLDFLVPAGPCERAAQTLAHELGSQWEISLEATDRDPEAIRILIGAPWDAALEPLARRLSVEPLAGGFCLLGREYTARGDALVAVLEDPVRRGRPLCLVLGNDLGRVGVYLDRLPRLSRPELVVYDDGELALVCPLEPDGRPREAEAHDYRERRERYFAAGPTYEIEGARVHLRNPMDRGRWQAYVLSVLAARKRTLKWFGAKDPPTVELFVYEHPEDLEECLGAAELFVCNRLEPRVHVLLAPGMPDDGGAGLARVLARAVAGPPAEEWLAEGQALAAAGRYWQRPLDEWLAQLAAGRLLPPRDEVQLDEAAERYSEHVLVPARALLFQEAVRDSEPGRVRALWKGAALDARRVAALYQRGVQTAVPGGRRRAAAAVQPESLPFLHGLALVESDAVRYDSSAVDEALDEARALDPGPDAVSLTVFATADDPDPPLAGGRRRPAHGSASDLALAAAGTAARARGLRVLLALEVLAQPSGAWADVLPWASPEDRWLFWERYERVALHYAFLAELLGFELFSFGANLRESVRGTFEGEEPSEEQIRQRQINWQNVITRLHGAYRGRLTYGARLADAGEDVTFFERLDVLGLVLFPGVEAAEGEPDDELLRRLVRYELQQAVDLAVRWNRPLVLVQLGFPARRDSWARPAVPRGPLDLAAQQRYHEALADVLADPLENDETLQGFFLWNWPVDERHAGAEDAGHSLRQKPVEATLRRLFAR